MRNFRVLAHLAWLVGASSSTLACTSSTGSDGASPSAAGQSASAGQTAASGAAGSSAQSGSAGDPDGVGGAPSAGSTSGGAGGSTNGGAGSAGANASNAGAGTGGGLMPSAGCGLADPPTGELEMMVEGSPAPYLVTVPSDYDAATPYPMVFGFHGRDRTHIDCQQGDCAGFAAAMSEQAVLVYMKSQGGGGWEGPDELELNVTFFTMMLDHMKQNYCIDESRIFAAGTSSGANFTNILACRFGDQLRGVSPVAGHMLETENCKGQVAPLVIHGVDDYHVSFEGGKEARDFYLSWNQCSNMADRDEAVIHELVVANPESHECITYEGCLPGYPVRWCEHSEGGYDGSTHGWPQFGGDEIWAFFQAL